MKVILFDFFGVLSEPVYTKVIRAYIPEPERADWMKKLDILDIGDLQEKELDRQIAERSGSSEEEIRNAVENAPVGNDELFRYIEDTLKGKYRVGLLTNAPRSLVEHIAGSRLSLFDPLLISSDLKMIKPHKEIFEEAIRRCGTAPEEILFIDDSERNIKAAEQLGINGIMYKDFSSFLTQIHQVLD